MAGRIFWNFEVVSRMSLNQIIIGSNDDSVALIVLGKTRINVAEVLSNFDGRMQGVVAVEGPIGGEHEQQIAIVPSEVFMAEVVGEFIAEIRPHCDIEVLLESDEEVVQQLGLSLAHTHRKILVGVIVLNRDVLQGGIQWRFGIVEVEENVVDLQNYQEFFCLLPRHLNYYNRCQSKDYNIIDTLLLFVCPYVQSLKMVVCLIV